MEIYTRVLWGCVYTNVIGQCRKPAEHSSTFGFANTQNPNKKPKEPEFCQRT